MIPIYTLAKGDALPKRLVQRAGKQDVSAVVREIIEQVRTRGDEALLDYTLRFDGADITALGLHVSATEIEAAYERVSPEFIQALGRACARIRSFHEKQKQQTWLDVQPDMTLGQLVRPLDSAGIYVPGGSAPLSSSVLMNALPAQVAGVERIVMATPPRPDGSIAPEILIAARECGVKEIYRVGGAQAIAALAYGTQSIAGVDKIVGPGNMYVAGAKREVFGQVGIDMIAGPSEVLIVADDSARAQWVAADMLSQAEHDPMACAVLITDCARLAGEVAKVLEERMGQLTREKIARASIDTHSAILVVENLSVAMEYANLLAPEHLELCVHKPHDLLGQVRHAGACFLGHYSPEPLGDYFAGPNHVLPTTGTARFSSPLSVDDFVKKTSIIHCSRQGLLDSYQDVALLARAELLEAHARSVEARFVQEDA